MAVPMRSADLYARLAHDFDLESCDDSWPELTEHKQVCDSFKAIHMGLVLDYAAEVEAVYSSVFPDADVINAILDAEVQDCLLFTHHPMSWNLASEPVWSFISDEHLQQMRERRIAFYALHTPLDRDSGYGTARTLAHAVGLEPTGGFFRYHGHDAGLYGSAPDDDPAAFRARAEVAVGHEIAVHEYGEAFRMIGVVGGGISRDALEEAAALGIDAIVTGISVVNKHSANAHSYAESRGISWFGLTHYSSESFACKAMTGYFQNLGLESTFVPGTPCMADIAMGRKDSL